MSNDNPIDESERDDPVVNDVVRALEETEHNVPPAARERLAQARRAAVAVADRPSPGLLQPRYVAAGTAAAVALAVALLLRPTDVALPPLGDAELVVAQDAELMEELEFAAWMLAMDESDDAPHSG